MKTRTPIQFVEKLLGLSHPDAEEDATLQNWREYTFELMLNAGVLIGIFAFTTMLIAFVKEDEWDTVVVSAIVYFIGILGIKYAIKPKSYRLRAFLFLAVFYVAGISMGILKATVGDGRIWLLFMVTFAAIFLGIKEGIIAALVSAVSWLVLGGVVFRYHWIKYPHAHLVSLLDRDNYSLWTTTGVILGSVGLTIVAAITGILRNLNTSLDQSRSLTEKLKHEEEKYRLLVNNSPDLILEIDRDFRVITCNPAMAKSLGYKNKKEELVGRHLQSIITPEEKMRKYAKLISEAFEKGTVGFEDQRGGRYFYSVLIPNTERGTIQIVTHDITSRKKAQQKLIVYQEHLEELVEERSADLQQEIAERERAEKMAMAAQKLADLGMLTTGVAHELNSPLQGMQSVSDYLLGHLKEVCADQSFLQEQVEIVQDGVSRCAKIVRSLRYYAHTSPEDYTEQKVEDLISSTLLLAKHQLGHSNISINAKLADDMPALICSRDQIMQVLINLLTNARDAMPDGGDITIWVDHNPNQRLFELKVIDEGEGIPAEYQDQIFKPFFTTKSVGEGVGLGLFIVSGIVHSHGGELDIESSPDEGTTVTLTLAEEPPHDVPPPSLYGRYADFM